MRTIVSAPCRIHFGLFHVPSMDSKSESGTLRKFGGLGLMIQQPRIHVVHKWSNVFSLSGSLKNRTAEFLEHTCPLEQVVIQADGPEEHTGLGVGTALGLAVATAMCPDKTADELAVLIGRGQRSGIGIHGFQHGGFIVDDGKILDEPPRIAERLDFPESWPILLIRPRLSVRWYGENERSVFSRPRRYHETESITNRLRKIAFDEIVPSLKHGDYDRFAGSLTTFNRLAGTPFEADQNGPYAHPFLTEIIEHIQEWGGSGIGQSSWGPTLFQITREPDEAEHFKRLLETTYGNKLEVTITHADCQGAVISADEPANQSDAKDIGQQHEK